MNKVRGNDIVFALLLLVVVVAPLPIGSNRPLFWAISAAAIFAVTALFFLTNRHHIKFDWRTVTITGALAFLFCAYLLLQASGSFVPNLEGWSIAPRASLLGFLRSFGYVCFFGLMVRVFVAPWRKRWAADVIFLSISAYAIFGFALFLGMVDTPEILDFDSYDGSATGPFINRNSFATYLGFGVLLGLGLMVQRFRDIQNNSGRSNTSGLQFIDVKLSIYTVLLVLVLATLFATNSRMGVFSTVVSVVVFFVILAVQAGRVALWQTLFLSVVVIFAIAVVGVLYGDTLLDRYGTSENDLATRLELYRQTISLIKVHPWRGSGADTFPLAFQQIHTLPLSPDLVWDKTHNTYLALWAEHGLLVGSIPIVGVFALFVGALRRAVRGGDASIMPTVAVSVIILAALHSLIDFSLEIQANTYVFISIVTLGTSRNLGLFNRVGRNLDAH